MQSTYQSSLAKHVFRKTRNESRTLISRSQQKISSNSMINPLVLSKNDTFSLKRSFATVSTVSDTKVSDTTVTQKKNDNNSNIFLDNLGTIFLSSIGLIIAALVRSHFGTKNKTHIRDLIEEQSAIDPFELDDLRNANSEFNISVFNEIKNDIIKLAKQKANSTDEQQSVLTLSYDEFVIAVRTTMTRQKGESFTIQLGHLLDRVVLSALDRRRKNSNSELPISFWLTVLSMALNSPTEERIKILFEIMQEKDVKKDELTQNYGDSFDDSSPRRTIDGSENKNKTLTIHDVRELVGYLQDTCQLSPDTQVLATSTKYPVQQYDVGTPEQLVVWSKSSTDKKVGDDKEEELQENKIIDIETFKYILRSKAVCVWGECYRKD